MSTDGKLTFEDGLVTLGTDLIPGILVEQRVGCSVRYDEAKHDGMSGKKKVVKGWNDADISLTLDLLTDDTTCYDKLKIINNLFRGKTTTPKVLTVTNQHVNARGIKTVVFDGLESYETDQDDVIQTVLSFTEHNPPVVKREQHATAAKKVTGPPPVPRKVTPKPAPAIVQDTPSPVIAGYLAGRGY